MIDLHADDSAINNYVTRYMEYLPYSTRGLTQEELDAIYVRTPDPVKKTKRSAPVTVTAGKAAAFCNGDRLQSRNIPFGISGNSFGQSYFLVYG